MQNPGGNKGSSNKQSNQSAETNNYEMLTPLSKMVLNMFQVTQTIGLLVVAWLWKNGSDNWLGNLMPSAGTFVAMVIMFNVFVMLWVQRIRVLKTAK